MTDTNGHDGIQMDDGSGAACCLCRGVSEAIVEALSCRDFSHWKHEEDDAYGLEYLLELGGGYRLYAKLPMKYLGGPITYRLLYNGDHFMLCFDAEYYTADDHEIAFKNDGSHLSIRLSGDLDAQEYAKDFKARASTERIVWKDRKGEETELDAYRSESVYRGVTDGWDTPPYDSRFKDALIRAVTICDFSELERYADSRGNSCGPADHIFVGIDEAGYCSDIEGIVSKRSDPISFWLRGNLCSDGDGIVIRGDRAAYTVKISGEDMEAFYERNTDIPDDETYLRDHPAPSFNDVIGDRREELEKLLEDV